jgi:hypothetical protein
MGMIDMPSAAKVPAAPLGERLECSLIAKTLDEQDRPDREVVVNRRSREVEGAADPLVMRHLDHNGIDPPPL